MNHISNGGCLTTKGGLLKSLEDYARIFNRRVAGSSRYANYCFSRHLKSFIVHVIGELLVVYLGV